MSEQTPTQVTTSNGLIRFSYLHVWEPRANEQGGDPKYSTCLLIRKDDVVNLNAIRAAVAAAKALGIAKGKYKGKPTEVPSFKLPLRDGDAEKPGDPAYAGCYFINSTSDTPVGVVGADAKKVDAFQRDTIYSGMFGNVFINFYPFEFQGVIGVGCGLNGIQKVYDGERLAGVADVETVFSPVANAQAAGDSGSIL